MITKRFWDTTCKVCGAPLRLREYEGLEGGIYGACKQFSDHTRPVEDDDCYDYADFDKAAQPATKENY